MYNTIISSMSKDDVLTVTNPETIPGRTMIGAGDLSVYIDTDRLPELIFKLQACLPEHEKIRLYRHVIVTCADVSDDEIARALLTRMGTQL